MDARVYSAADVHARFAAGSRLGVEIIVSEYEIDRIKSKLGQHEGGAHLALLHPIIRLSQRLGAASQRFLRVRGQE